MLRSIGSSVRKMTTSARMRKTTRPIIDTFLNFVTLYFLTISLLQSRRRGRRFWLAQSHQKVCSYRLTCFPRPGCAPDPLQQLLRPIFSRLPPRRPFVWLHQEKDRQITLRKHWSWTPAQNPFCDRIFSFCATKCLHDASTDRKSRAKPFQMTFSCCL